MESLLILIPVALIFVAVAIKIFFWAVNSGQFDDLDTEARRILFDDDFKQSPRLNGRQNKKDSSVDAKNTEAKNVIINSSNINSSNVNSSNVNSSNVNSSNVKTLDVEITQSKAIESDPNERF